MKIFGWDIGLLNRLKTNQEVTEVRKELQAIRASNTFWGYIRESYSGAWQQNITISREETLSYFAIYDCVSLIAQDISKMGIDLIQKIGDIWEVASSAAFSPVLAKPNHYQTRIGFIQSWVTSKLIQGNTYVLKQRDNRGIVIALYVLDPLRVTPLVSESGDVFYQINSDFLAGVETQITVPASEIIHDKGLTLFHPLIGVSPIYACGITATNGLKIQGNSTKFFTNMSRPSGILSAPGAISDETAARLKSAWETNFSGDNMGKLAVVGDGLKYEAMTVTPQDAQMVEQLRMTADIICSVFHVPAYKVLGTAPAYNNIEALTQDYYSQALQIHIESIELLLDEGLQLGPKYSCRFDLGSLLRMDTATRYQAHSLAIGAGWLAPNEARAREDLPPVKGGAMPYLQQQNYSLEALAKRDAGDPFAKPAAPPPQQALPPPDMPPPAKAIDPDVTELIWTAFLRKELELEHGTR